MTIMGEFDCCKIPVICKVVQMMRDGEIEDKDYLQFAFDLKTIYNTIMV